MFPFDPPENIRKPKVFWCFQGDQKRTLGRKGFNLFYQYFRKIRKRSIRNISKRIGYKSKSFWYFLLVLGLED